MSFTTLDATDYVVSSDSITAPAWSSNIPTLSTFVSQNTSNFYLDVYNTTPSSINAAVQFSIAWGQAIGSGSAPFNTLIPENTPSRVNYGQYRNIVYGDAESYFNFGGLGTAVKNIIAIPIDRNRYKESLFPGTFNLRLTNSATGETVTLTDNSNDVTTITYLDCGRVFDIVYGSNGTAISSPTFTGATVKGYTPSGSYGMFLPDVGLIVLNGDALSLPFTNGGLTAVWDFGNTNSLSNETALFNFISTGASFQLNSQETISSNYIFVRVKNGDYNYTTNPSIITGSGDFVYSNFIQSPQTFITTVGLYNTNNDLLAVAKLSKPLVKDFTKEALVRVKLDW